MKNSQRLSAVVVLTLTLTLSASAGHMTTWGTEPPSPPPDSTQTAEGDTETGAEGDIHIWNSEANAASMEAVLSLLQSVLPVF